MWRGSRGKKVTMQRDLDQESNFWPCDWKAMFLCGVGGLWATMLLLDWHHQALTIKLILQQCLRKTGTCGEFVVLWMCPSVLELVLVYRELSMRATYTHVRWTLVEKWSGTGKWEKHRRWLQRTVFIVFSIRLHFSSLCVKSVCSATAQEVEGHCTLSFDVLLNRSWVKPALKYTLHFESNEAVIYKMSITFYSIG